jgi:predicted nuclease of predicted toxin-antitoxin system
MRRGDLKSEKFSWRAREDSGGYELVSEMVQSLETADIEAIHWSTIGKASAPDTEILAYASASGYVVLTQDLDFSAILASTADRRPSVV